MIPHPTPCNRLWHGLPRECHKRLANGVEQVDLAPQQVLSEPFRRPSYILFPLTGTTVSLLCETADGSAAEVAVVGYEGVVGISLLMGDTGALSRAVVDAPGTALRLTAASARSEFHHNGALQAQLLRYIQARLVLMAQLSICNQHHSLEQRLCRWLLMRHDRLCAEQAGALQVTHEAIAHMLGVRREGVSLAIGKLERAGLVERHRARLQVCDPEGLELRACECRQTINRAFERLFPEAHTRTPTAPTSGREH